MAMPGFIEVPQ